MCHEAITVLTELVALKDIKDRLDEMKVVTETASLPFMTRVPAWTGPGAMAALEEYERRKPLAWAAARRLLKEKTQDNKST
jgi:hypothetical protein